jgi:hypothetical protein
VARAQIWRNDQIERLSDGLLGRETENARRARFPELTMPARSVAMIALEAVATIALPKSGR